MTADNAHNAIKKLDDYFELSTYAIGSPTESLKPVFALRYEVFCRECGFLNEDDYPEKIEFDDFDPASAHFSAQNTSGLVVGASRLVTGSSEREFPFLSHCQPFDDFSPPGPSECVEVSRLAVHKNYRRRSGDRLSGINPSELEGARASGGPGSDKRVNAPLLVLGLYREMYRYSYSNGIRYWYAAMEKPLARVLGLYGFVFEPIGPEQDYYGPVTPYIGDLRKLEKRVRSYNPELLRWFQGKS